jgi:hypothetical protein
LKTNRPCADCGFIFPPRAMEFDHIDSRNKHGDVCALLYRSNWSIVLKEIKKCELVCANCHALRTDRRFRGLRSRDQQGLQSPAAGSVTSATRH